MPSIPHEGPADLVREHPEIAVELVRGRPGVKLPAHPTVSLAPTDMSAVVPVQYLADMVVLISDAATGKAALAVIIEPQLRDRETKRYSWPVYVATARRLSKCPRAVLVVLCPDPAEAARCRRTIRTGHPGFDLTPIVIDSGSPPGNHDGDRGPYLTVFTAAMGGIDMATEPGARQVLDAMAGPGVSDTDRFRMTTIILKIASDAARQVLEAMMRTTNYEKTFIERIHDEGIAEGEAKGKAEGKAEAVLRLLDARGLAPTDAQRRQVTACTDPAQLDLWFDRAIAATTATEVFADLPPGTATPVRRTEAVSSCCRIGRRPYARTNVFGIKERRARSGDPGAERSRQRGRTRVNRVLAHPPGAGRPWGTRRPRPRRPGRLRPRCR